MKENNSGSFCNHRQQRILGAAWKRFQYLQIGYFYIYHYYFNIDLQNTYIVNPTHLVFVNDLPLQLFFSGENKLIQLNK